MHSTSIPANNQADVQQCITCGKDFLPARNHPDQRFCSEHCNARWYEQNPDKRKTSHWFVCQHCGKHYAAKKKDRGQFCSRACAYAWLKEHGRPERRKQTWQNPKPLQECLVCGKLCPRRGMKYCSDVCRKHAKCAKSRNVAQRKHATHVLSRVCKCCGEAFTPEYGSKRRMFCGEECQRRYDKQQQRKKHGGTFNANARKRLRLRYGDQWSQYYEPINKRKVFQRDRWRCQLCGCKLHESSTWNPQQATVDHIIPLSLGGDHKYTNVQAACMKCNTRKGASVEGQQRLL